MRKRVLFVLHLPPPLHGASLVGSRIRESELLQASFDAHYVNLSTSGSLQEIGRMGWRKVRSLLSLFRTLRREVRAFSPDLVYLTPTMTLPGFLKDWWIVRSLKRSGCRIIVHLHNKGAGAWKDRAWASRLYRSFFRDIRVIVLSERLFSDIEPYVSRDRVSVCPNGVPSLSVPATREREVPTVLFLSNLIPSKGVEVLLDACALLRRKGIRFACAVAGAPSPACMEEDLDRMLQERDLSDSVRYLGPLAGAAKQTAFSEADVFAFPTFYPLECFPLVILEAMSAGLPVVTTPEGGIPDMVRDGETGFLCPQRDAEATAACLERLLGDPGLRHRMGGQARKDYEARFTEACFERNLLAVLENAL